jgi:hypothetical protein
MKVLILDRLVPFQAGPDDALAATLSRRLEHAGHQAEIMRLPFSDAPGMLPAQLLMLHAFELMNVDHVIALSLPAGMVRHPRKTFWLDARTPAPWPDLFNNACAGALAASRNVYLRSVAARDGLPAGDATPRTLLPVPGTQDLAAPDAPPATEPVLLAGGAVLAAAPCALLLDALALAPHSRLCIAGVPGDAATAALLAAAQQRADIGPRLVLSLAAGPSPQMIAGALALVCIGAAPQDVDGAAFALAGAGAARALVARDDSDTLDLARNCLTGWNVAPDPAALASAFEAASLQPARTQAYGRRARALLMINRETEWDNVLEALLR